MYSTGWVLFDENDSTKVLARSDSPTFGTCPIFSHSFSGAKIVFVEGMVRDGSRFLFYYGGADKNVGVVSAPVL